MGSERVLVCGTSARAAAESAARSGFAVTALDAFADLDQHEDVRALSLPCDVGRPFTASAAAAAARRIDGDAVVYLSPFENYPRAVRALSAGRHLWGNPPGVLTRVRNPRLVSAALRACGFPSLQVIAAGEAAVLPTGGTWLIKPLRSGGGRSIRPWINGTRLGPGSYLQEQANGTPGSLVFVAAHGRIRPLGLSRQLIGEPAFGASAYRYCGNILGPRQDPQFERPDALRSAVCEAASAIAAEFGLVGVNGIDFVAADGVPYVVEVNPRWTSAMELVERAFGISVFAAHARACQWHELPDPPPAADGVVSAVGKAIVFARRDVTMDATSGWLRDAFVRDVPREGEQIRSGQPICTIFGSGRDARECRDALARRASRVYAAVEAHERRT